MSPETDSRVNFGSGGQEDVADSGVPFRDDVIFENNRNNRLLKATLACPTHILVDVSSDIVVVEGEIEELLEYAVQYRETNKDDPDLQLAIYERKDVLVF